jgi:hypothetical protein
VLRKTEDVGLFDLVLAVGFLSVSANDRGRDDDPDVE